MIRFTVAVIFSVGLITLGLVSYIRLELAFPGIMAFTDWIGQPDVFAAYENIAHVHGLFATTLFILSAAFLSFTAGARRAPLGNLWGYTALIIGLFQLVLALWETGAMLWPDRLPIYPLRLENYAGIKDFSAGALFLSEDYFRMSALTLTILASAACICTSKPYQIGSGMLSIITLITFGLFNFFRLHTGADIGLSLFIVPEVVLLAILAIVMVDPMRPDEPHLTIGIGVVLITGMAFDLVSTLADDMFLGKSYYFIANNHLAQHGLMLFIFFAGWFRWKLPTGPQWLLWGHSGALGLALLLTYLPMMTIGQRGGMRHMPNSTDEFPFLHLTSSVGAAILITIILIGLYAPRLFSSRR
jgi:hypothetical protein